MRKKATIITFIILLIANIADAGITFFSAAECGTPGSCPWTVPSGVTSIIVECQANGGAGGDGDDNGNGGAGGGGGGYAKKTLTVTAGQTYYAYPSWLGTDCKFKGTDNSTVLVWAVTGDGATGTSRGAGKCGLVGDVLLCGTDGQPPSGETGGHGGNGAMWGCGTQGWASFQSCPSPTGPEYLCPGQTYPGCNGAYYNPSGLCWGGGGGGGGGAYGGVGCMDADGFIKISYTDLHNKAGVPVILFDHNGNSVTLFDKNGNPL